MLKNYFFLIALACVSTLLAQNFVVANVTVFDGETVLENQSVLVENGFVSAVQSNIENTVPTIDGSGKFLMPALTNAHVHAFMALNTLEAAKAGVLQLFDMHGMEQYQKMMQDNCKENSQSADFYFAGNAATAPEGHGTQFGFDMPTLTQPKEAQQFVKDRIATGASYIKIIVEPWRNTLDEPTITALIQEAHALEVPAVVHISKLKDANFVIENEADGLVHIWWDTAVTSEMLAAWKTKKAFIMPTILTSHLALENIRKSDPKRKFLSNDAILEEVKKVYDAGIPLLAGTDPPNVGINYGTDLYKELALMTKAGIPNIEVLKTATSNPSRYFNINDTGFIKKGYKANMLLLNESPLNNIENIATIHTIWKEGVKVKRD